MAYPTPAEAAVIKAAEKLMVDTMARYDPSHDAYHGETDKSIKSTHGRITDASYFCSFTVQRVRKTALSLANNVSSTSFRKPDLLTIELAALLHDVLDKKYVSSEAASNPYTFFLPFFQLMASEHGVDLIGDGRARQIVKVIENVSWSTEKRLMESGLLEDWHKDCIELHCVQDADRLDAIGAFGKISGPWCIT